LIPNLSQIKFYEKLRAVRIVGLISIVHARRIHLLTAIFPDSTISRTIFLQSSTATIPPSNRPHLIPRELFQKVYEFFFHARKNFVFIPTLFKAFRIRPIGDISKDARSLLFAFLSI
jgi:hypothetical protein